MLLKDFNYPLPSDQIAFHPLKERTQARLLVVDRKSGLLSHRIFSDLPDYLKSGDLLVLNNVKVIPARLLGSRATGGKVEALLLKEEQGTWKALLKPGGKVRKGDFLIFRRGQEQLEAEIMDAPQKETGERRVRFKHQDPLSMILKIGHMPLPPYIRRPDEKTDQDDYQTVFASKYGAIAAPTAGLHFDQPMLDRLRALGVEIVEVTLYVGYGTFQPIMTERVEDHRMHEERYEISLEAAEKITRAKSEKRRVVACGTTVIRTLESAAFETGEVRPGEAKTQLFIYPPFRFRIADALITNFHLPESSLLVLTAAFAGTDLIMRAYLEAVNQKYRFFSYGDCMLIE